MANPGIRVAEENDDVNGGNILRLDSGKKQFKYRRIIDYKFAMPAVALNTQYSKTLNLDFNTDGSSIGFIPAYEYYVQSFSGYWGIPVVASQGTYEASLPDFPFFKEEEYVTDKKFHVVLSINNLTPATPNYAYPAYTATLRLVLLHDNLEAI